MRERERERKREKERQRDRETERKRQRHKGLQPAALPAAHLIGPLAVERRARLL